MQCSSLIKKHDTEVFDAYSKHKLESQIEKLPTEDENNSSQKDLKLRSNVIDSPVVYVRQFFHRSLNWLGDPTKMSSQIHHDKQENPFAESAGIEDHYDDSQSTNVEDRDMLVPRECHRTVRVINSDGMTDKQHHQHAAFDDGYLIRKVSIAVHDAEKESKSQYAFPDTDEDEGEDTGITIG